MTSENSYTEIVKVCMKLLIVKICGCIACRRKKESAVYRQNGDQLIDFVRTLEYNIFDFLYSV